MKTLYLVRHAKSSWEFDVTDHERPLNERGLNDAPRVASHVATHLPKPDKFISSDAIRAKTTALFFVKAYGVDDRTIVLNHQLYDFEGQQLLQVIRSTDDAVDTLMVFGHNYAMTNVVNSYGDKITDNVPTAGCTAIRFEVNSWKDISQGTTFYTCTPKQLKND